MDSFFDEDMLAVTLAIVANMMSVTCQRDAVSLYGLESFTGGGVSDGVESFVRRQHSIPPLHRGTSRIDCVGNTCRI